MVVAQPAFADGQAAPQGGQRLVAAPGRLLQGADVVQHVGHIGVVGPELLLDHGQRALVRRQRFTRAALRVEPAAQVVQRHGHLGMHGPEQLLGHRQRALQQLPGARVLAQRTIDLGQHVQAHQDLRVRRREQLLADRQAALGSRQCPVELAQIVLRGGQVAQQQRREPVLRPHLPLDDRQAARVVVGAARQRPGQAVVLAQVAQALCDGHGIGRLQCFAYRQAALQQGPRQVQLPGTLQRQAVVVGRCRRRRMVLSEQPLMQFDAAAVQAQRHLRLAGFARDIAQVG